jgi:hypothetical protein
VWKGRQQPGRERKLASFYYSKIFFAEPNFIPLAHLYSYNGNDIRLDIKGVKWEEKKIIRTLAFLAAFLWSILLTML